MSGRRPRLSEAERDELEVERARAALAPTTDGVPAFLPALPFTPTEERELTAVREAIKHGFPAEAALLARLLSGWRLTGDDEDLPGIGGGGRATRV